MRRGLLATFVLGAIVSVLVSSACSSTGGGGGGVAGGGFGGVSATGGGGGGAGGHTGGIGNVSGSGGGIILDGSNGDAGSAGFTGDPKTCAQAQQSKTYIGCDFWPTVVANNVWSIFDYAVVVANAGDNPADITIERNGAQVANGTVQPNSLEKFFLPWVLELKGPDSNSCGTATPLAATVRAPGGAYHLTSTFPVTVYQFNALEYGAQGGPPGKDWSACPAPQCGLECFSYTNDASLLLPTPVLTGNYRIIGQHGWPLANIGAYFAVTGTEDNTDVTALISLAGQIQAGGGIASTGPGQKLQFSINRGEVVEVVGTPAADLSGTLLQATHPVQVITGIPCIDQPDGVQACDHVEESVFPAETLGKHYFVTPPTGPNGDAPGHIVRIFGNVDGTTLQYPFGQPAGAPTSIGAGQVVDLGIVNQPFEILSPDHEFAVGSFQLGGELVDPTAPLGSQKGDPAMSFATAVEQYRSKYVFLAPDDYDVSYVDIVVPDGAQVTLDGSALSAPMSALGSGYSLARTKLGGGVAGAHLLESDKPVGIQVMGYGSYTSYQYPGGSNFTLIAPPPPPIK